MDLSIGRGEEVGNYWTVIGDIATALFLVFVLLLILQHIRSIEAVLIDKELDNRQKRVESALNMELDEGVVHIEKLTPERQRMRFSSDVLFASCKTDLKPAGKDILLRTGEILQQEGIQPRYFESISVEGHTDIQPTTGENCPFVSNWELSTRRATAVVHLLEKQAGIPGEKLSATGQAQYHSIDTGSDTESFSKNRRIELTVQYDREQVVNQIKPKSVAD